MKNKFIFILFAVVFLSSCDIETHTTDFIQYSSNSKINMAESKSENSISVSEEKNSTSTAILPKRVNDSEFEFGDYFLLVKESDSQVSRSQDFTYTFSLLGNTENSKSEIVDWYGLINERYYRKYEVDLSDLDTADFDIEPFEKYYFERNVERISEDGKKVLCHSFRRNDSIDPYYWDQIYEIYEGDCLIYSFTQKGVEGIDGKFIPTLNLNGCFIINVMLKNTIYINFDKQTETVFEDLIFPNMGSTNSNSCAVLAKDNNGTQIVKLYSLESGEMYQEIYIPDVSRITQLTNNGEILVELADEKCSVLIKETDSNKRIVIGEAAIGAIISPDNKYLAYRSPNSYEFENSDREFGFYIINLEENVMLFVPVKSEARYFEVVGWVKKEITD